MNHEQIMSMKIDLKKSIENYFISNYDVVKSKLDLLNEGFDGASKHLGRNIDFFTYDEYCSTLLKSFDESYDNLDKVLFDELDISEEDKLQIISNANVEFVKNNDFITMEEANEIIDMELDKMRAFKFTKFRNTILFTVWKTFIENSLKSRMSDEELKNANLIFNENFFNIVKNNL